MGAGLVDVLRLEVVPAEDLLSPKFEAWEKVKIVAISERELLLAVKDEPLDWIGVVIYVGVGNERVDPIHLHRDLTVYRNLSQGNCLAE